MSIVLGVLFALAIVFSTLIAFVAPKLWQKIVAGIVGVAIIALAVIFFHSLWLLLWAALLSLSTILFCLVKENKIVKVLLGIVVLALVIGGIFFVLPTTYAGDIPTAVEVTDPSNVCTDPSSIAYGSYSLKAGEAVNGPAIIEWWDQTPATYDKATGRLNLSAMKGHEGIQFLMSGETTTPADGIVGTVFVLAQDNDLLCVKNQHLLAFYSKPQHVYAANPEELILPVPQAPTK